MKLPFIGEVVAKSHHDEVVRELRAQIERLESEKWIAFNRLFETVQGIPLDEAIHQAGEPARSTDPAPHQKKAERSVEEEQSLEARRLGALLSVAGRKMSHIVRRRTAEESRRYNKIEGKEAVARMLDVARLQGIKDADDALRRQALVEAAEEKPTPEEVSA